MQTTRNEGKSTEDYITSGFAKIDADIRYLIGCLREVLERLGEPGTAKALPWQGEGHDQTTSNAPEIEQAYSIAFQLLNMVEEAAAGRTRLLREHADAASDNPGTWAYYLARLAKSGVGEDAIAEFFPSVRVEPVLTAHPTESKRPAVLAQHRALHALLEQIDSPRQSARDRARLRQLIEIALERLWRSGEILIEKPEVATERTGILFHLREVFPKALPLLDRSLDEAWVEAGYDPNRLTDPSAWPRVRFGTWVGGDRDGHPLVTAQVTEETLLELRRGALIVLDRELLALASALPLSLIVQQPPEAMLDRLGELTALLGPTAANIISQYPDEPWRQFVLMLRARLPLDALRDDNSRLSQAVHAYRYPEELDTDLRLLNESLTAIHADRLAKFSVWPVRRALDVFAFHLASLDIRQNSAFHDRAMGQILESAGLPGADFATWEEDRRLEFLNAELRSPRPFLFDDSGIGTEADAVLSSYRVLRLHLEQFGPEGIGSLIVSMTRSLSDLLVVYVLAREAGLTKWADGKLICELPVVPLFETGDDLARSAGLMAEFIAHPVTAASLPYQQMRRRSTPARSAPRPIQQVMIGYSDSNKDVGILASQWGLYRAQREIAAAGSNSGVQVRFFHGRGGTISRGAGPTHRFLDALPGGTVQGDFRLTEQGETIAQKYANVTTASHNLELLLAGVTAVSLEQLHGATQPADEIDKLWTLLAETSTAAYTGLVRAEGFIDFYSEATPIDALEVTRIGSRPARRTGQRTLADLRAIPWVFSWNQSRFYLPGWFGVGSGLRALAEREPDLFANVRADLRKRPVVYYVLTNVETNLASADLEIMREYASLVHNDTIRERFLTQIEKEFNETRRMLDDIFQGEVAKRRPRMLKTLALRADALKTLHRRQIATLREWRACESPTESAKLLPKVLLSINAIASGLRTTG